MLHRREREAEVGRLNKTRLYLDVPSLGMELSVPTVPCLSVLDDAAIAMLAESEWKEGPDTLEILAESVRRLLMPLSDDLIRRKLDEVIGEAGGSEEEYREFFNSLAVISTMSRNLGAVIDYSVDINRSEVLRWLQQCRPDTFDKLEKSGLCAESEILENMNLSDNRALFE